MNLLTLKTMSFVFAKKWPNLQISLSSPFQASFSFISQNQGLKNK